MLFVGGLFALLWTRRVEPVGRHLTTLSGATMGTTWTVRTVTDTALSARKQKALRRDIQGQLDAVNSAMSTYLDDSEVSRFSDHADTTPFPLSAQTLAVLKVAQQVSALSGGAFDVTIAPVVDAWGFCVGEPLRPPTPAEIALMMAAVGSEKLTLTADTAAKSSPDLRIDLSAIAKGFGVDQVAEELADHDIDAYMVEVGGEVRTSGHNQSDQRWRIGIETPDAERGTVYTVLALEGAALATSGDYRNYYEQDGVRISHTIDARTGRPIAHALASVSVIHETATMADALATAINVLGPEEGMALAQSLSLPVLMLIRQAPGVFVEKASPALAPYQVTSPSPAQEQP